MSSNNNCNNCGRFMGDTCKNPNCRNGLVRLDASERSKQAADLWDFFNEHMIGQERARRYIVRAWEEFNSPLWEYGHGPIFTGLFLGPSGVGKTYLMQLLAEFLVEKRSGLVKIDCASYSERYAVSNLIGAPPGYIGYSGMSQGKKSEGYKTPL